RKILGIDEDAFVVIAPGRIRKIEERDLVLKVFHSIKEKKKILISPYMLPFSLQNDFKGRILVKRIFDVNKWKSRMMKKKFIPPKYIFDFKFCDPKKLSLLMSA